MGEFERIWSFSRWALPWAMLASLLLHLVLLLGWPVRQPGGEKADAVVGATRMTAVLRQLPDAAPPAIVPEAHPQGRRAPAPAMSSRPRAHAGAPSVLQIAPGSPANRALAPVESLTTSVAAGPVGGAVGGLPPVSASPSSPVPGAPPGQAMVLPAGGGSDDALRSYRQALESFVRRHKRYPVLARERGWQGTVGVEVQGGGAGGVPLVHIARVSGYPLLDQQAREMITSAVLRVALPDALANAGFRLALSIEYRLDE